MYYLLWIEIEGFYTAASASAPLQVIHRDKVVLDAGAEARAKKVQPGMSLAEARAILPEGRFVSWEEEHYREAQTRWLDLCADYTDVIEPIEQHSALLDLSSHPDPTTLATRLLEQLCAAGWSARGGAARTRWVARLACQGAFLLNEALDGASFVGPLPVSVLPVPADEAERLAFLGSPTIREVTKLSLETLRDQFGERAISLRRYALGRGETEVQALYPPDSYSAYFRLEGPAETVQALHHSLQRLARKLGARLREDDLSGKHAELFLEGEEGSIEKRERAFTKPMHSEGSVYASLVLLMSEPPKVPVVGIRVRLTQVTRSKSVQKELSGQLDRGERERSAMAAFAHVRTVFGDQAVQVGSEREVPRRTRLMRVWKDATGWS